jgi:hypothetical protein
MELTVTIIGCPWEAFNTKNIACPGWMGALITPVVALERKLIRVASGGTNVDPTGGRVGIEKVGEAKTGDVAVAGGVGVITGVIARIVAATIVSTAFGTVVGMADPRQATVTMSTMKPVAKICLVSVIQFSK